MRAVYLRHKQKRIPSPDRAPRHARRFLYIEYNLLQANKKPVLNFQDGLATVAERTGLEPATPGVTGPFLFLYKTMDYRLFLSN